VSPRYAKYFTFGKKDWDDLKKKGKRCYVFIAHKPRDKLPKNIQNYIKWGETTPLVKPRKRGVKPKTADKSLASLRRAKDKNSFYGWYDLGVLIPVKISVVRRAWHKARFILTDFPCGLDEGAFISFIPRKNVNLTKSQIKALLAYLNSTLAQLFIETLGISAGGGASGLDVRTACEFPILDIRKLHKKKVKELAKLFDKLEFEARNIGGVLKKEDVDKLQPVINEIDKEIFSILNLDDKLIEILHKQVFALMDRRLARAGKAMPESVKGEEEPRRIKPPKKRKAKKPEEVHRPLTSWM